MPVISEVVHPLSLNFANQRKVVMLRDTKKMTWDEIAAKVRNLKGMPSTRGVATRVYKEFSARLGRRKFKYAACGRKRTKVTKQVTAYLVKQLKALRTKCVCTSTTLQRLLLKDLGVSLEASTVRRELQRNGYSWLPRKQKRKYSQEDQAARLDFASSVVAMRPSQLRARLALAMDGVVLTMPPAGAVDRHNYCTHGDTHMWRKQGEGNAPELAGGDAYGGQVHLSRAIPMWGGVSEGGFAVVTFHPYKKLNGEQWVEAVGSGKLRTAIQSLKPAKEKGPWTVLCDNESFLTAVSSRAAHRAAKVNMWHIPPRSPDLNPVEKFWGWLRKEL
jgi:transposase